MLERIYHLWYREPDPDRPPPRTGMALAWVVVALLAYLVSPLNDDEFHLKISESGIELALGGAIVGRARVVSPVPAESWTWPATEANTGVRAGVALEPYLGPCTITTDGAQIIGKTVVCAPLRINALNVLVEDSVVDGGIDVSSYLNSAYDDGYQVGVDPVPDPADPTLDYNGDGPTAVTVRYSELLATGDFRPISIGQFNVEYSTLTEGHSGGECHNNGRFYRSYLRGFGEHASGLRVLRNCEIEESTVWCQPNYDADEDNNGIPDADGGCSADTVYYEQFGRPGNNTMTHNYYPATLAYFCVRQDGGSGDGNQVFIDNVFEKGPGGGIAGPNCGQSSPIEGFEVGSATYSGNEYDDGTPITGST